MRFVQKFYCDADLIRFLREKDLILSGNSQATISVTTAKKKELMIFMGQSEEDSTYEARVYKAKPGDKYIPHIMDKCIKYEENEEYATFFFDTFENMKDFVNWIALRHMEYVRRPMIK